MGPSVGDAAAGVGVVPLVSVFGASGDAESLEGDATADGVVVLAVVVDSATCDVGDFGAEATADVVVVLSVVVDGTIGDPVGWTSDFAAGVVVVLSVVVEALGDTLVCEGEAAGDSMGLLVCSVVTDTVGLCTVVVCVPVDVDGVVDPWGAPGLGLGFDGFGWGEATGVGLTGGDDCEPCPNC